jgi:hypothetical protein
MKNEKGLSPIGRKNYVFGAQISSQSACILGWRLGKFGLVFGPKDSNREVLSFRGVKIRKTVDIT